MLIQKKYVPVTVIINTGSNITIISGNMFKTVIAEAGLKKEQFKTIDKQAFTYNIIITCCLGCMGKF